MCNRQTREVGFGLCYGHLMGACVSDSLRRRGQMPDRTELDEINPFRPSGCLSLLPGWRCHRARAICYPMHSTLRVLRAMSATRQSQAKISCLRDHQGRAPCNPRTTVEY